MPRKAKKPKMTFAERLEFGYKRYDPSKEGYGNVHDWRSAWDRVMGHEEALSILGDQNPLAILGFQSLPTSVELKKRYRELILANHPDKGGDTSKAQALIAAYSELKDRCA